MTMTKMHRVCLSFAALLALAVVAGCGDAYDVKQVGPGVWRVKPGAGRRVTVREPGRLFAVEHDRVRELRRAPGETDVRLDTLDPRPGCQFHVVLLPGDPGRAAPAPDPPPGPPRPQPPGCPEDLGVVCESICMRCVPCCPRPPDRPICRR